MDMNFNHSNFLMSHIKVDFFCKPVCSKQSLLPTGLFVLCVVIEENAKRPYGKNNTKLLTDETKKRISEKVAFLRNIHYVLGSSQFNFVT